MSHLDALDDARTAFLNCCAATTFPGDIHAVTFQPTPNRVNEDRYVVQEWDDISGRPWVFLAVLDGHGGTHTAEYAQNNLPGFIRAALRTRVAGLDANSLDPDVISELLSSQVKNFDDSIGRAVVSRCPKPEALADIQAQALIEGPDAEVFRRANSGTTLVAALIDGTKNHLWVVGLGDSSVVLSTISQSGIRRGERLLTLHNPSTPSEYARIKLEHPSQEQNIMKNDRVLGVLSVTRALGDFSFKLSSEFSRCIFTRIPSRFPGFPIHNVTDDNHTPPYISSTSEVRYINLAQLKSKRPILLLYTDGVNNIIDGRFVFRRQNPCIREPAEVMGMLLGDKLDHEFMQDVFEHKVELEWNGPRSASNLAAELLGNVLGGTNASRLMQVLTPELLGDDEEDSFYIDDTTIITCPLA
ncbi:[Pyruvate dehydrogenase [acetyl-transferring]]-phosphatase 1, mitochondrial [Hypsizygus marmoreus]|uniref:[Pyruvate dehydrogenase [acetyl-transferring]]-phosphatase 1, mitochondrial n=1 Tax=Hypsizygus marmoreus TaxID=39966 RepID=A0A369K094_HYPMA|nr:[Pyruvate dehydrogenase [acetyl-transferring]]-phosphatase 1, mitochondrial [Hypsizygus marmoreus]